MTKKETLAQRLVAIRNLVDKALTQLDDVNSLVESDEDSLIGVDIEETADCLCEARVKLYTMIGKTA